MILEPTSSNVNDKFTFQSSNVDVALVDTTGNIRALSVGTTIITVTNATNNIFEKEVMVLALPPVEGLQLNVVSEQNNLFYVGKIYQVTLDFLPDKSYDSDVRYSYTASFIDFNEKTGHIKFSKAGKYSLTAYLASDWQTQTTIEFEVVYSDEVEAYNLLFIGNSLTKYTYNIPNFIYEMLRADDVVVNFLLDSTTPQWIIDHEINFNFLITKDQYTHVFLQEYSNGPIMDYKKFEDAVVLFDKKLKHKALKLYFIKHGATTMKTHYHVII
nr:Ig-like domain-containing protein [Acholeplasma laidlawii]